MPEIPLAPLRRNQIGSYMPEGDNAHVDWLRRRAPQVAFSARILHQELRAQRGFTGCYEVVKVAVRPLRATATVAAVTQMRFETAPGEQAQVDWGQVKGRADRRRAAAARPSLGSSRG